MKKLIKANLTEILRCVPNYFPVPKESIEHDVEQLCRMEETDYLFLARREKSWLFDMPSIYTLGSYANLTWTYGETNPDLPAAALFLHVAEAKDEIPWGSVTLLDYQKSIEDVKLFEELPEPQRQRHINILCRRFTHVSPYCSMKEVMDFLRERGESKWT